jgi:uncharacterized protein YabE (DUF348 family)
MRVARRRRRRRITAVAGLTAGAMLIGGGAYAVGEANKSVTIDIDGNVAAASTYAGTVEGLLADQGVRLSEHDLVTPALDTPLADGTEVVVRFAHEVTYSDGQTHTTWITALDATAALDALAGRGARVELVPSRSGNRVALPMRLDADGPVAVLVDGTTITVDNGRDGLDSALAAAGVTLGPLDSVRIVSAADAGLAAGTAEVAVVIKRIAESDVTTTFPVPFETQTQDDPTLFVGESVVLQAGVDGQRVVIEHVVTTDGAETSRSPVSDELSTQPVPEILAVGTKTKPVVPATLPVQPGTARAIGQELAAQRGWTGDQWACLDALWERESHWNPASHNVTSGAHGIPQALPGSKMASVGADWETNPATQITWGLGYIEGRYGTPCDAWAHFQSSLWY